MESNLDDYAAFLNELSGLIDEAESLGWDESGIRSLQEAQQFFRADFRELEALNCAAALRQDEVGKG